MTRNDFEEIKNAPEFARLVRLALAAAAVWLAFAAVLGFALSAKSANEARLREAGAVLRGAAELRSYPERSVVSAEEPLTAVSAILDKTGLRGRVAQLSSSPAGLALQVNRLYPDEFESLAEEIRKNGLAVKTAEVRALEARRDGRLLNVSLTIEGERE